MAKKARRRKKRQQSTENNDVNWLVVGGIGGLGVIFLAAMMYLTVKSPEAPKPPDEFPLWSYCDDRPNACVSMGDKNPPVTIIEVSDFGCGHCRNFNADTAPIIEQQYVDTGIVQYISLPFALGTGTLIGANAAMCANEQDAYFDYQSALFASTDNDNYLTPEGVTETAVNLGLDKAAFEGCLGSGKYSNTINNNISVAQEAGVSATPSFFINGRLVEGNNPIENFASFIAEAQDE